MSIHIDLKPNLDRHEYNNIENYAAYIYKECHVSVPKIWVQIGMDTYIYSYDYSLYL